METQIVHIIDPMLDHELEEQLARLHRTRKGRMQPRSTKGNSTLIHCDDVFIYIKRKSNVFFFWTRILLLKNLVCNISDSKSTLSFV